MDSGREGGRNKGRSGASLHFPQQQPKAVDEAASVLKACEPDAYLVRNMESLEFIREHQLLDGGRRIDLRLHTLYDEPTGPGLLSGPWSQARDCAGGIKLPGAFKKGLCRR